MSEDYILGASQKQKYSEFDDSREDGGKKRPDVGSGEGTGGGVARHGYFKYPVIGKNGASAFDRFGDIKNIVCFVKHQN